MATVAISEHNVKHDVLGLVLALVEIIRDVLRVQALKRVESGMLTEEECERLGKTFLDLDKVLAEIKEEQGITDAVRAVREGWDGVVDEIISRMVEPAAG